VPRLWGAGLVFERSIPRTKSAAEMPGSPPSYLFEKKKDRNGKLKLFSGELEAD